MAPGGKAFIIFNFPPGVFLSARAGARLIPAPLNSGTINSGTVVYPKISSHSPSAVAPVHALDHPGRGGSRRNHTDSLPRIRKTPGTTLPGAEHHCPI